MILVKRNYFNTLYKDCRWEFSRHFLFAHLWFAQLKSEKYDIHLTRLKKSQNSKNTLQLK